MSVSIQQEPTQLNTVYTKLLYSITTSNFSLPQFKFVCDIEDYNGNLIQRLRQPANDTGHAIFNVAVPIRPQLKVDDTLYIQEPTASIGYGDNPINSYKQFKVKFGEEYGTSPSSSVIIYDGAGAIGEPIVSGSDLVLGRMLWEPWNEGFALSSSATPPFVSDETGSLNFFVYEASGGNYVDNNLRVNGVFPAGGFGGSGSFSWSGSSSTNNGEYLLEVMSLSGVSSADQRFSLEVYDMSNQQMIIDISDVSGSGGINEILISEPFTGSTGVVYGCRTQGIPTSSFNPPQFEAYYFANDLTASSVPIRSGAYPLYPGNVVNIDTQLANKAYEITINTAPTTEIGQALEVYPSIEDFSLGEIPFITPPATGSYASFNFNAQDVRINWTSSNPNYTGTNAECKAILTNWPQYQKEQLRDDRSFDNLALQTSNRFRGVASNDLGIVSWFNISGSIGEFDTTDRAYGVSLYYFSPESSSLETGQINSSASFTGPALNTLSPALVTDGSGANIPFCSGPLFPGNLPTLNTSVEWNFLKLQINQGSINWWRRDEPCDYETRSNFAFINKWGVWDFIGLNTPTNKNAVISKRDGFQSVNNDYNAAVSLYSPYNRGFEQYYLNQDYKYKIATEYMGSVDSSFYGDFSIENFYQELFISPNVMLQVGDKFVPINLSNSKFVFKTNKKGQKKYAVEIQYEFSNKPRSRT
jgi:hypothetical protein